MISFSIIRIKIGISQNCFDLQSCYTPFQKPEKQENNVGYDISHKIIQIRTGISQNCFDLQSCYTPFQKSEKQENHLGYDVSHKTIQNIQIIKYKKNR